MNRNFSVSVILSPYFLVFLAFIVNSIFLYLYNPHYHFTLTQLHGQVGYNINVYGSVALNPELTQKMDRERSSRQMLIDYNCVDSCQFQAPSKPFVTNDTIGYGLVLGLLWKITHSYSFKDVQWLQIAIYSLLMILLYQIAFLLFGSAQIAFSACLAHLLFFPLIAMNVQPVRDVWAYYGVVILVYGMLHYLFNKGSLWRLLVCALGFSVCQFIRPSVFLALLTMSFVFFMYGLVHRALIKNVTFMIASLWCVNVLCFWVPFMVYNKITYNRYFVGPVGLDLLEGLGEFPNRWGYKLDDIWASDYICTKYKVLPGTPEFDDKAQQEFNQAFKQEPLTYVLNIFKRLPGLVLPGLPWIFYTVSPYAGASLWQEKLQSIMHSKDLMIDFLLRHIYIRLYLFLGYLGAIMLLMQRRYFLVALLFGGILLGGLGKLPSHIEYRYVVPYYWVFGLCAAYACFDVFSKPGLLRTFFLWSTGNRG